MAVARTCSNEFVWFLGDRWVAGGMGQCKEAFIFKDTKWRFCCYPITSFTALGEVRTVADLLATVLRSIAEQRGLDTWEKLTAFASEEWYPSRIAFGKH